MAGFGANYPCFKPENKDAGVVLGKLVSANLTVNLASGELYADDGLAEQLTEFSSGNIAMETDDMSDENAGVVYGCTVSGGLVTYNKDDTPPRGCLGYYKVLMRGGKKYFRAYFYPRVSAALGNDSAQTRGNSITFATSSTTFTVFADDIGDWRKTQTFSTASAAKAWINEKCGISKYYEVSVVVQGAGDGKSVDAASVNFVTAGSDFVMNITGHESVAAAYDNAEDILTSIVDGAYTVPKINEDHSLVIIFA